MHNVPFRKPKRIRTAFTPPQLLKLEQSFEKNHYVVGQERKDLASKLGLTETQVKMALEPVFVKNNQHNLVLKIYVKENVDFLFKVLLWFKRIFIPKHQFLLY